MIHEIITVTDVHTARTDAEIVQVVIHLLNHGCTAMTILKNAHAETSQENAGGSGRSGQPDPGPQGAPGGDLQGS